MDTNVPTNVDEFHFFALFVPKEIDDVEILEVSTHVVSEVNAIFRVATGRSPVGGVVLQRLHSCQTQAIKIPILGVLVYWIVVLEGSRIENGKFAIRKAK